MTNVNDKNSNGKETTDEIIWLTVKQAAARAQVGPKVIYRAVQSGRLRGSHVNARRDLRFHVGWVDQWLESTAPLPMHKQ